MATLSCFFHLMTIFLYSSLLLILFSYFPDKSLALESHFGTVDISSLLTASECSRQLTDLNGWPKSTLEVFHRNGPCSPTGSINYMPSAHHILHQDRTRVQSLQARSKPNRYKSQFQDTTEVANIPVQFSPTDYAITISLGTPRQELTLIFDTGSDLTWTRCSSDTSIYIYRPRINFNPDASTSFLTIPCANSICTQLIPNHGCCLFNNNINNTCLYDIQYGNMSYSIGVFSMDNLTITQTDEAFTDFRFGCAQDRNGSAFDDVAGMLGLGRGPLSFVEQTKRAYSGVLSYCFPSTASSTGFLKLGPRDYPNDVKFTPLSTRSDYTSFYFINVTSISVGGVLLSSIDPLKLEHPATIIDSGTVITRLPMNVYSTMRDEFQKQMNSSGYQIVPITVEILDTCYNTSGYSNITVPTISFTFDSNVTVDLDASTTLYAINSTLACLAFAGNIDDNDLSIFGNTQQKKFEVVYDVDGGKLGFIPGACN